MLTNPNDCSQVGQMIPFMSFPDNVSRLLIYYFSALLFCTLIFIPLHKFKPNNLTLNLKQRAFYTTYQRGMEACLKILTILLPNGLGPKRTMVHVVLQVITNNISLLQEQTHLIA